jgi:hypothetical protein
MGRIIWLTSLLAFLSWSAFAAPADDGQTAGTRAWTLNQARLAVAVTPDDANDLATAPTRAVWNGNAAVCNLAVRMADGGTTAVTFVSVQPGQILPFQVKRIMSTNTTCTNILALY